MVLRPAADDDREMVLRWRNHPSVRAASFTRHEIGPAEHARWWSAVRGDSSRRMLIYERDSVPAGVVLFSAYDRTSATWAYYLDVAGTTGRGDELAVWFGLERAALDHAFQVLGVALLRGEVLARNAAVRALHRRFGFREVGEYMRDIDGHPEEVVQIELRSDEHAHR